MDLLGDVLFQGQRRNFRRRDTSEAEQLRAPNELRVSDERLAEANVNRDLLEGSSGELGGDVVPRGGALRCVEFLGALDTKDGRIRSASAGGGQARPRS